MRVLVVHRRLAGGTSSGAAGRSVLWGRLVVWDRLEDHIRNTTREELNIKT